jgi:hypothetical protein
MKTLKELVNIYEGILSGDLKGFQEVNDGVYLSSGSFLIEEQESCDEEDEAKEYEFDSELLYVTTNDGYIESICSFKDLLEVIHFEERNLSVNEILELYCKTTKNNNLIKQKGVCLL